jgi:uncharacterized Zn-finger protein
MSRRRLEVEELRPCSFCGRMFRTLHRARVRGEDVYLCPYCYAEYLRNVRSYL